MQKRFLKISGLVLFGLLVSFFVFRGFILTKILTVISHQAKASYQLNITYKKAGFNGFTTVYIRGLNVLSETGDTIVKSDSILVSPRLLPMLIGKKRLSGIAIYNTDIQLNSNLLHLLHRHNTTQDTSTVTNYAQILNSLQNKFFAFSPKWVTIRNSGFIYKHDTIVSSVYLANFNYQKNIFLGDVVTSDHCNKKYCLIKGVLDRGERNLTAIICHTDTSLVQLPYINPRWQAFIGFDTLRFSLSFKKENANLLNISGDASASNLAIKYNRIGPDLVVTKNGSIDFTFHVGDRYVELDSASTVNINKFSFSPYLRYEKYNDRKLTFSFIREEFEAQDLFESLPAGLFSNFDGIKTKGKLAYHLNVSLNFDNPDSVLFDSKLESKGFVITKYGATDFRMMNGSFTHRVYDKDRYIKSIIVGSENPDFVPLQDISPYLRYSILTSEDGDFFYHHGFNQNAFRESIATNMKEHRFARGGSTISMQLIKNIFLRGNKTICRKLEEALIVWTIENLHLVSKERMYEVYLNIIEMGPGIYGIKPASKFYFNKLPSELTLSEGIFISSIIPRPKGFRYTFVSNGVLRDYLTNYYKMLGNIMLRRNQITPYDTINLKPNIELTGEAKNYLAKPDTTAIEDSLFYLDAKPAILNKIEE